MSATAQVPSVSLMRTPPLPVLRRSLAESWRSTLACALALVAVSSLYLPLYPSIGGAQMADLIASMPPELINSLGFDTIGTGAGYAQSTVYGLLGFLLLTVAGCAWGASAIAGAEETGRLELTLAHGVSRMQYAIESALSILTRLVALIAVLTLLVLALNGPSQLEVEPVNIVAGGAALLGLTLFSATIALAVGALTGRRSAGIGAGAGVAILGYVLNAIGNQNESLAWVHHFSPYDWAFANSPLVEGTDWAGIGLLALGSILAAAIATIALQRRDIIG